MTSRRSFMLGCAGVLIVTEAGLAQTPPRAIPPPPHGMLQPWARVGNDRVAAAYATLLNDTDRPARLIAARSDRAERVELHRTTMEGGTMQMRPVEAIEIPPRGRVTLAPGGLHFMLIGLKSPFKAGETVDIWLQYQGEPEWSYRFPVFPAGHPGPGQR